MKYAWILPALFFCAALAAGQPGDSVHQRHMEQTPEDAAAIRQDVLEGAAAAKAAPPALRSRSSATPQISEDFIVFGYEQSETGGYDPYNHIRWHALTHVGVSFVYFNSSGRLTNPSAFTGRAAQYKAGGAAQAAGVKVILVIASFDDAAGGAIQTVMTTPALRATLISEIVNLVTTDAYCHGVSLDLEFSWGATTRDGVTAFFRELRAALPAQYEISVYTNPTFYSSQWDFDAATGITPSINYMIYSGYDYASGTTAHAITDFDTALGSTHIMAYLNDGLPPEKLVIAISAYAGRWSGTTVYNGAGTAAKTAIGFTDAKFDTTLNPNNGGPFANNYVTGDEVAWYTYNDGTNRTVTWDNETALEYKIRHALSLQDPAGAWNGRRIRGVAFWSLYWMMEISSWDPITNAAATKTRMYPHIFQICAESLKAPGVTRFLIDGFEGSLPRWRDPDESPDTDGAHSKAIVTKPGGAGAPANSTNAQQVTFSFTGAGAHKAFFRHEVLAHPVAPYPIDTNAVAAVFDVNHAICAYVYTPAAYAGYSVRMVVMDKDRELEKSGPFPLGAAGWREIRWPLNDPAQIFACATAEPAFRSGDGALDTAGGGARDLAFAGFLIEGSGAMSGNVVFDELAYEHQNPGGKNYTINEFRYADPDREFVEIYGPAGAFPAGFQLRLISRANGSASAISLAGRSIPDDGGGYGFFVVGDPDTPNVDYTAGFTAAGDDIANTDPPALQLYDSATGCVYDSVVFEAFGGLGDLIRRETLGATGEGYPWIGEIASGSTASGAPYTMGRYPDGADSQRNNADFSVMPPSPGARNGATVSLPATFDFTTAPPAAFQSFQSFVIASPAAAGLPASPGGGGNAHRCVDVSGGGVMSFIGDAALGAGGTGYRATGEIYIPSASEPVQAIAIGLCGRQGSTFFTASAYAGGSGYESGYLLIYENAAGAGLNDGRADHPGVFEFVYATNDNMDATPVALLGSASLAATGAAAGAWTSFDLSINPAAPAGSRLVAKINNYTIFSGEIPSGGPTSGAFQAGFRENHTGAPAAREGAWIDNLRLLSNTPNSAPVWSGATLVKPAATAGAPYSAAIALGAGADVWDPDGNPLTLSKVAGSWSGPAGSSDWLAIASGGALSNTRALTAADIGTHSWTARAEDGQGGAATTRLQIEVQRAPLPGRLLIVR